MQILDIRPGHYGFLSLHNVTIVIWACQPDGAAIERLAQLGNERIRSHPEGLSDVHLVRGRIGFPDSSTRAALIHASKSAVPHLAAVAAVIQGSGFWASTMRSVITGIRVFVPGPFELRLFGSVDEVAAWLPDIHAKRTGIAISAQALRSALEQAEQLVLQQPLAAGA